MGERKQDRVSEYISSISRVSGSGESNHGMHGSQLSQSDSDSQTIVEVGHQHNNNTTKFLSAEAESFMFRIGMLFARPRTSAADFILKG